MTDASQPNFNLEALAEAVLVPDGQADSATDLDRQLLQAVSMDVDVQTGRKRCVTARLLVPASVSRLWQVLSHYEALASFIPNLAISRKIDYLPGRTCIEQVGSQKFFRFNFSARVVLEMQEHYPTQIDFRMLEGDFQEFYGSWSLEEQEPEASDSTPQPQTLLTYQLFVLPKRAMPVQLVECRLNRDLPHNLVAVYQQAVSD